MSDFKRVQHPIFGKYSTKAPGPDVQILDEPAADRSGRPLPAEPLAVPEATQEAAGLTGKALAAALAERGLPNTGSAEEKRTAIATHDAGLPPVTTPDGDPADQNQEV